jgi:hypothetical protein
MTTQDDDIPPRAVLYEELCEELFDVLLTHGKMYTLLVPEMLGCLDVVKARVIDESSSLYGDTEEE